MSRAIASVAMVDPAGESLERRAQRALPAAVRDVRALGGPAEQPVVAAPRRPLADPDLGMDMALVLGHGLVEAHDVERPARVRLGRHEALEEQVAERLVVAVELAVGGDHERRRGVVVEGVGQSRRNAFAREPVRVGGRGGLERDRPREVAVVEHRGDVAAATHVHAVGPPRVDVGRVSLPWRQDHDPHARLRRDPQRGQVDGGLGQPHRGRLAAEAVGEVPEAPHDLGPPVGERRERQDRVVEALGDPRPATRAIVLGERGEDRRAPRGRGTRSASRRGSTRCGRGCRAPRSGRSTPR